VKIVRATLFWIGFGFTTVIATTLLTASYFLPLYLRFRIASSWSWATLKWLKITCNLDYKVEGKENVPKGGAHVVLGNHQSTWETIACNLFFSPAVWVMKKEVLRIPVFGWGARAIQPIAIDRASGKRAVEQVKLVGIKRLKQGYFVVLFPEGTRVLPGKKARYKVGGAVLAEAAKVSVLPFAHNAGKFWHRMQYTKTPGVVRVKIGKPIDTTGLTAQEIMTKVEAWVRTTEIEIAKDAENEKQEAGQNSN